MSVLSIFRPGRHILLPSFASCNICLRIQSLLYIFLYYALLLFRLCICLATFKCNQTLELISVIAPCSSSTHYRRLLFASCGTKICLNSTNSFNGLQGTHHTPKNINIYRYIQTFLCAYVCMYVFYFYAICFLVFVWALKRVKKGSDSIF